jgi:hypothetical protein
MIGFVAGVITFAAGMTWLVVKISPAGSSKPKSPAS